MLGSGYSTLAAAINRGGLFIRPLQNFAIICGRQEAKSKNSREYSLGFQLLTPARGRFFRARL